MRRHTGPQPSHGAPTGRRPRRYRSQPHLVRSVACLCVRWTVSRWVRRESWSGARLAVGWIERGRKGVGCMLDLPAGGFFAHQGELRGTPSKGVAPTCLFCFVFPYKHKHTHARRPLRIRVLSEPQALPRAVRRRRFRAPTRSTTPQPRTWPSSRRVVATARSRARN